MSEEYSYVAEVKSAWTQPELSDWICHTFGSNGFGISWRPRKGEEPNWFWRWMQFLAFGNRWERRP